MRIGRVVIAGAGLAGLRAAEELRARDYPGGITMIGAERRPPYDRPPLTKKFMTGEIDDTSLRADLTALAVDLRLGEAATGLRDGVLGTDRAEYGFDALVVATGATPVRLPGPGPQRVLRTFDHAAALRSALRPGLKLAVIGAGWIGAELATSAAKKGCEVTVLEAAPAPLASALGTEAGSRTVPWYSAAGVDLRLGGRRRGGDRGRRPAGGRLAGRVRGAAAERGGGGRGAARLGPRRLRRRGLRRVLVPPVRRPDPGRALGFRHPRPGGGGGEHPGRQRPLRPGALLLVGAVRADGPVLRAPHRRRPAGVARGHRRPRLDGVLAGRGQPGRHGGAADRGQPERHGGAAGWGQRGRHGGAAGCGAGRGQAT